MKPSIDRVRGRLYVGPDVFAEM